MKQVLYLCVCVDQCVRLHCLCHCKNILFSAETNTITYMYLNHCLHTASRFYQMNLRFSHALTLFALQIFVVLSLLSQLLVLQFLSALGHRQRTDLHRRRAEFNFARLPRQRKTVLVWVVLLKSVHFVVEVAIIQYVDSVFIGCANTATVQNKDRLWITQLYIVSDYTPLY